MSTMAPGVRPQYIEALKRRADWASRGAGLPPHDTPHAQRARALAEVLELDGEGAINLDELPALRAWFVASTTGVAVYMPRRWNGQHADSERPMVERDGRARIRTDHGLVDLPHVILTTERRPKHGGDDFPLAKVTGRIGHALSQHYLGGVAYTDWADVGLIDELATYSPTDTES